MCKICMFRKCLCENTTSPGLRTEVWNEVILVNNQGSIFVEFYHNVEKCSFGKGSFCKTLSNNPKTVDMMYLMGCMLFQVEAWATLLKNDSSLQKPPYTSLTLVKQKASYYQRLLRVDQQKSDKVRERLEDSGLIATHRAVGSAPMVSLTPKGIGFFTCAYHNFVFPPNYALLT